MKIVHLSDLHLGKRVNEFPMLEEQEYILTKIINIIDGEKPEAVIIAGDVYDKSVPSAEAVALFDEFLYKLSKRGLQVFVISGNHDSSERIAFGGRLMDASGVRMSPVYSGEVAAVTLKDEHGEVRFYMLPFIKPAHVRKCFPDAEISTYTDAVRTAVEKMNIDKSVRNVLITHQFVTGAERSDSEEISVGGTDNVDACVFDGFDYVALGHIHRPQNVGKNARYCGTPLKYSFSEAGHEKSVTVAELGKKGSLEIRTVPLKPRRDMVEIKGSYNELTLKSFYENTTLQDDYVHITLTDEEDIPDGIGKLRTVYKNLMKLDYDNTRTRTDAQTGVAAVEKTPFELFSDFYEIQNNRPFSDEQAEFVKSLIEKITEDE
ncbi:MAG: exonuclease SbcCD subunit D [Clostridia bacterium]|nr:exonuclease SbcCD subunit D [Clostridia bacterium]